MSLISFTRRYRDRSDNTGFQFEFLCDVCNASHMTCFQYSPMGVASSLVTAASWIMNRGRNLGVASQQLHKLLRGKEWEDAYAKAVDEAKKSFRQCTRCNGWVCPENCYNVKGTQCRLCAPNLADEAVSMKAQAGKVQMFAKALQSDQTDGRDMSENQVSRCPHCRAQTTGKFCTDCGKSIFVDVYCVDCGAHWTSDRNYRFCPTCGETMPEPDKVVELAEKSSPAKASGKKAAEKKSSSQPGSAGVPAGTTSDATKSKNNNAARKAAASAKTEKAAQPAKAKVAAMKPKPAATEAKTVAKPKSTAKPKEASKATTRTTKAKATKAKIASSKSKTIAAKARATRKVQPKSTSKSKTKPKR